eukprot:5008119-Amphidinium_carterae.1
MEQANRDALNQHRLTVGERYRTEFEDELRAVRHQVEMLQQAQADNNVVTTLQDEVLCERQRRALDGRRLEELIAVAEDRSRAHEHHANQLGQRLMQVTEMNEVKTAEVLAEVEELEASSSPRFNKIDTSDFGVHALNVTMNGQQTPMQPQTASFSNSTGTRRDCGQADGRMPPPGLGTPMASAGMKPQTPSTAAAASPVPNLHFSRLSQTG